MAERSFAEEVGKLRLGALMDVVDRAGVTLAPATRAGLCDAAPACAAIADAMP
jgi:hypothetical protein